MGAVGAAAYYAAPGADDVNAAAVKSHFEALRGSDKKTADKLFAALREARDAMRRGATPAGAISYDRDPEVEYRFPDDEP